MTGRAWSIEDWRAWCADYVERHAGSMGAKGPTSGVIKRLSADTRTLQHPGDTVFFALRGPWHDGHDHAFKAFEAGVRRFVVERNIEQDWVKQSDVLVVGDVLLAMQEMARHQRRAFLGPVLAITGSNGKTTVKEWIARLLPETAAVHRSPLSHNSQLGVPMSLWSLDNHHDLSIVEAGISHPGEMSRLQHCIEPTEGVFTHLGEAHAGNFDSLSHLAQEKCSLFLNCSRVFMPHAFKAICRPWLRAELVTWGFCDKPSHADANLLVNLSLSDHVIELRWNGQTASTALPFRDVASVRNSMTAALVALHHGAALEDVAQRLSVLHSLTGRLSTIQRAQGGVLIQDDCSHDLGSLAVGLDALNQSNNDYPSIAIVGDVPQSGLDHTQRCVALSDCLAQSNLSAVWMWVPDWSQDERETFGRHFKQTCDQKNSIDVRCFSDRQQLEDVARATSSANVLIKVKSGERLGAVINALAPRRHVTELRLNASALIDNVRVLKSHTGAHGVIAVIKGLGYGTDPVVLGKILESQGVDWLAVAYADEGAALREAGIQARVLVMNPDPSTFDVLHEHQLEPQLVSLQHVQHAIQWANKHGLTEWPIHLKLDTGMHRLGLAPSEDESAARLLSTSPLKLASVMSHLAGADGPEHDERTRGQIMQFHRRSQAHYSNVPAHILNSAASSRVAEIMTPEQRGDWAPVLSHIRIGLAMYGVGTGAAELGLQPVLSLETRVSKLVDIPAHEGVGYGFTGASDHDRTLAILSVGYADGYPRSLGNGQGRVLWEGHLLPTVGRVCMDMITVDVTELDVQPGDRMTLWGQQPGLHEVATAAKTIPYELLVRIGPRVRRVIER